MRRYVVYILVVFGVVACGSSPVAPVSTPDKILLNPSTGTYRVQAGDGLYAIAWRFGLDYQDLARWNNLTVNGLIHPGQTLVLNGTLAPTIKPKPLSKPAKKRWQPTKAKKPTVKVVAKPNKKVVVKKPMVSGPLRWRWPLGGGEKVHRKGTAEYIKFFGKSGQSIRAAASGQVVYVGSGLRGYGKLIIIKHNKNYLSAYGHNQRLLVQEGQSVNSGDKIATMGHSERNKAMLHFEIRQNGKPVNPLRYLPKS